MNPPLYILAGGRSRRFGSDKARASHRGVPLLVSVATALAPSTEGPVVVAAVDGQYSDMGLSTIGDLRPDRGPLGGLATALADLPDRHPNAEWLLLAACDLIDPDPAWVTDLVDAAGESSAVAFRDDAGWQPLLALYHESLLPDVTARLDHADLSLQALLSDIGAEARPTPADFRQASTPEDLARG